MKPEQSEPGAPPECPGAALRISRAAFDQLRSGGELFASSRNEIPQDGLGHARVMCKAPCEQIPKTTSGALLFYGLCRSCSMLEADNRATLCSRQSA